MDVDERIFRVFETQREEPHQSAFSLVTTNFKVQGNVPLNFVQDANMVVPYKFLDLGNKWPHGLRVGFVIHVMVDHML